MNKQEIIQDYKNGMTIAEIARKNHVANSTISGYIKPLNLPNNKVIVGINNWEGFKEFLSQYIILQILCKKYMINYSSIRISKELHENLSRKELLK